MEFDEHNPQDRDILRTPSSRLYHLKPEGVGTPLVESSVSYLARLAEEHCLSPMGLMAFVIGPIASRRFAHGPSTCERFFSDKRRIGVLCGSGPIASEWIRALERLTGWSDLSYLTLVSLDRLMKAPTQTTLRAERAWCPDCLDLWRCAGSTLYTPLLWMMRVVALCPIHRTPLATVCPNTACKRKATWLLTQAHQGRCTHCGSWLGRCGSPDGSTPRSVSSVRARTDSSDQSMASGHCVWQIRSSESVGALLAFASRQDVATPSLIVEQSLTCWRSAITPVIGKLIHRRAGVTPHLLRSWSEGTERASLALVLRLCGVLEISAAELLWSDLPTIHRQVNVVAERLR